MKNQIKENKNHSRKGFSLVEMLIVVAIIGIIATTSILALGGTRSKVVLEDAQASVINALELARSRASTGVKITSPSGSNHGIYVDVPNNKIYSFEGDAWTGTGQEIKLPANISIINVFPTSTIIFNRLSGETNDGTITLKNNISGTEVDINITEEGVIF